MDLHRLLAQGRATLPLFGSPHRIVRQQTDKRLTPRLRRPVMKIV
jgi:hypothetical protein